MAGDNRSWTDWVGKRDLHCSGNPSASVANGIVDSTVRSMNYLIQKPGDVGFETYSLADLRVAVASGEVQLDWQARNNGKEMTVREALSTCYECGKEISSLATACPSCGAPLRAAQPSLGSTSGTASSALDFHVAREGKRFGPYTEVAARNYLADGRIGWTLVQGPLGCRFRLAGNDRHRSSRDRRSWNCFRAYILDWHDHSRDCCEAHRIDHAPKDQLNLFHLHAQ